MIGLALVLAAGSTAAADGRPTGLLIITDEQGDGDLSSHGIPVLKTPHLDRLYDEAVLLIDCHVSPLMLADPRRTGYRTLDQCDFQETPIPTARISAIRRRDR